MLWYKREEYYMEVIEDLIKQCKEKDALIEKMSAEYRDMFDMMNERNIQMAELMKAAIELKMEVSSERFKSAQKPSEDE